MATCVTAPLSVLARTYGAMALNSVLTATMRRTVVSIYFNKHADWEQFQACLTSSNIHTIENDDVDILDSISIKTIVLAAENSIPQIKSKKISKHTGNTLKD